MRFASAAQLLVIALSGVAVYSFVAAARDGERRRQCTTLCHLAPDYAARNRLAPDFELPSLEGRKVKLSEFRGKTVILNFWTKTCRPCLEEMPSIADLSRSLKREHPDIVVVTVTTDDSAEDARGTLQSVLGPETPFVTLVDSEGDVVNGRYGTKLYPETWFIDKNGVIRARFDGPRDWSSPLAVDFASSLSEPSSCPVEFGQRGASGPGAAVCEDVAGLPCRS